MSMPSAQVDELRAMAESVGLAMPQAATLMMEASDTICEMQASIDALDKENAKLLDLVRILVNCMGEVDRCDTCPINGNMHDVSVEDWFACDSLRDMLVESGVLDD